MDVQKKVAEAYESMYKEVALMAKQVLLESDASRLASGSGISTATSLPPSRMNDILGVIRETTDYWVALPEFSRKKLVDLKREAPKDSMRLDEMFEHLEFQIKHCHKALEHPMAGALSISKDFAKLNILHRME